MRDLAVMESKSTVFRNRKRQVARDDVGLKKVTWEGVEGGGEAAKKGVLFRFARNCSRVSSKASRLLLFAS